MCLHLATDADMGCNSFLVSEGGKDYPSYSSVRSFCKTISFQISASVRDKGNI